MCEGSEGLTVRNSGPDRSRVSWYPAPGGPPCVYRYTPPTPKYPQKIFFVPHSPEVHLGTAQLRLSSVFRTNCFKEHHKDSTQPIYGFPALTSLKIADPATNNEQNKIKSGGLDCDEIEGHINVIENT